MLLLAEELRGRYRLSFVCPPTPAGCNLLARAAGLGLPTLALEAQYHQKAALAALTAWLRARR